MKPKTQEIVIRRIEITVETVSFSRVRRINSTQKAGENDVETERTAEMALKPEFDKEV